MTALNRSIWCVKCAYTLAMKQTPKKSTAGESVAAATLEATPPQDVDAPRRCAIGDVQSMKGMLDDYVLHLLEVKYGM